MDVDRSSSRDHSSEDEESSPQTPGATAPADDRATPDPYVGALLDAAMQEQSDDDRPLSAEQEPATPADQAADAASSASPTDTSSADHATNQRTDVTDTDALRSAISVKPASGAAAKLSPGHTEFQAIVRAGVLEQISAHADENPGIEVGGVLIGTVYENPQASFVYIDGIIRGEETASRTTAVTFTAETWQHIHKILEEKHPGKKIIAWYHTHPGFGIFLSEMDLFIQRHFFDSPWQMAFVFDPQSRESGMFAWRQAQIRRVEYVVDDEKTGKTPEAAFPTLPYLSSPADFQEDPKPPGNPAAVEELAGRIAVLETRVKWLSAGFAILAAVAIIWPLLVPLVLPETKPAATQPAGPAGAKPGDAKPVLPLKSN